MLNALPQEHRNLCSLAAQRVVHPWWVQTDRRAKTMSCPLKRSERTRQKPDSAFQRSSTLSFANWEGGPTFTGDRGGRGSGSDMSAGGGGGRSSKLPPRIPINLLRVSTSWSGSESNSDFRNCQFPGCQTSRRLGPRGLASGTLSTWP